MKYTTIRQIPAGPRLVLCALYLTGLGLITAAGWIAADGTNTYLLLACWAVQIWLLTHLLRRT